MMRELRVVGVDVDGAHVICQDTESGERFKLDADERLRAAARGDLSRLGQIEIEMESSLRPREIQSRIRAGASVEEVAAVAGVPTDKIERFAHPVLLERQRATELGALAHPIRHDGPSTETLGDTVTEGLAAYGQNPSDATWDAWKGDDGHWVVQVNWQVGHTEHHAHWRFMPGSHGGTADPLDDLAEELIHPETIEPRRRLIPVSTPVMTSADDDHEEVTFDADALIGAQRSRHVEVRVEHDTYTLDFGLDDEAAQEPIVVDEAREPHDDRGAPAPPEQSTGQASDDSDSSTPNVDKTAEHRRRKSRKPAVPAWEDVLLGVRSNGNS